MEIIIKNKQQMQKFAYDMAKNAQNNQIFALFGNLGVGKSFFVKHFINSLQINQTEVLSPTFTLLNTYLTSKGEVFHFDLYRLKSHFELENIGFFLPINNNIMLIEWPEIALPFLPCDITKIYFTKASNNNYRNITIL
jgi:tRNA threonylcarbamoyladenosine biosynthesis protein TsaE